eukprot:CAMPEP_0114998776 /NCGR_PEP_ID=MMETSP0216-20121206/15729_1 /TAXON_ID=223996 /ORGANISM="Protocruzia adherens, Strain Boccale" /LENGTH=64 /DNA_ID=CAMNT_0002363479 /DNA_START=626 /DNA_END=817 /DNA_ORIENTATION=+
MHNGISAHNTRFRVRSPQSHLRKLPATTYQTTGISKPEEAQTVFFQEESSVLSSMRESASLAQG